LLLKIKIYLALFAFLISLFGSDYFRQESPSPNFLFFLVDYLGWTDLGCYESSFYDTPDMADSLHNKLKRWRLEVDARYPTPDPDN